jgi:hypothetical protein
VTSGLRCCRNCSWRASGGDREDGDAGGTAVCTAAAIQHFVSDYLASMRNIMTDVARKLLMNQNKYDP